MSDSSVGLEIREVGEVESEGHRMTLLHPKMDDCGNSFVGSEGFMGDSSFRTECQSFALDAPKLKF